METNRTEKIKSLSENISSPWKLTWNSRFKKNQQMFSSLHRQWDAQLYIISDEEFSIVHSLSRVQLFATPWITAHQDSLSIQTPRVYSNSCPLSRWCHPAISSSVVPFSSCPQSLQTSGCFPLSQLFAWGSQSIGVSASTSVLPMNTQDSSPSVWTGWISLESKGLSKVFSNTTVQKHHFLGAQLSSQSNSHIHTWPLEKP